MLMEDVKKLREETKTIICTCNKPDCPFNAAFDEESESGDESSPDLGFGSMELVNKRYSFPVVHSPPNSNRRKPSLPVNSTSLTNIPRGVQKRADGTIVEYNYPGFYNRNRWQAPVLRNGFSTSYLNYLDVCPIEKEEADCRVDQDGPVSNEDYFFSRAAPERKIISPRSGRKKSSLETLNLPRMSRHSSADVILGKSSNYRHSISAA